MIVVLVAAQGAPRVLNVSPEQLVLLVREGALPHTSSIPPGSYRSDFEQAWAILAKDMLHARQFETLEEALQFYRVGRTNLSLPKIVKIMDVLQQLARSMRV